MVGAPYPAVVRLVGIAIEHWGAIDGEAAHRGVDYFELRFDRWLNAIYWWSLQRTRDPEHFAARLDTPLGSLGRRVTEAELAADAASFMAFAAAFGVKPPGVGPGPAAAGNGHGLPSDHDTIGSGPGPA